MAMEGIMTAALKQRTAGILWLVASALSLAAASITYSGGGEIKWSLVAATVFLAAMGLTTLWRSRSGSA
jgi:hypothetical protein